MNWTVEDFTFDWDNSEDDRFWILFCSALFPDVLNCIQTDNLELKKLVYLYLMNYAKSQPDMAIMAVNTFVRVCFEYISWILLTYYLSFLYHIYKDSEYSKIWLLGSARDRLFCFVMSLICYIRQIYNIL